MIRSKNHASVLEHASAGFIVTTDRGISHEIVRHRLCSYSQVSTRYCNYGKDKFGGEISVIQPSELACDSPGWQDWYDSCVQAENAYLNMLSKGAKPQTARSVLPTCLATEIAWTANFREWLHICDLRGGAAAHPDIRVIIQQIKPILFELAPTVFEDFKASN
jgi:thymidylate synthase (FAD)